MEVIMKKIGIITLNGYKNYGNRLQNYALQEVIKSLGFEVETIIIEQGNNDSKYSKQLLTILNKNLIKRLGRKILNIKNKKSIEIRTTKFKEFSKKYITETKYNITDVNLPKENLSEYDNFVVGSDQVWNPFYIKNSSLYFLSFAPIEKRIAYAASFGIPSIPNEFKKRYEKYVAEMKYISVREEQGADIIKEMTGRDVQILLDPTMLLHRDQWISIAKVSSNKPKTSYLLTYFLGDISNSTKANIKKIAKDKKLQIIDLANLKDIRHYTADPSEFIDYINSATLFCTDSFHGVVFSILFEKPFIAFKRGKMNSRIDTLLSKFNLEDRKWENIRVIPNIYDIDYTHVIKILETERNNAYDYLKSAFEIEDKK